MTDDEFQKLDLEKHAAKSLVVEHSCIDGYEICTLR